MPSARSTVLALLLALASAACLALPTPARAQAVDADYSAARARMVEEHLRGRDITDERVLQAFGAELRERFVPPEYRTRSYADHPLPIGPQATISQPYMQALMTQLAQVKPGDKVLEVGTGSGYQAAILHRLGARVWTIELQADLAERARAALKATGHSQVQVITGDGWAGWPKAAPYDVILVTAAPPEIPQALLKQLADGGRMVIPVGPDGELQRLLLVVRQGDRYLQRPISAVRFVPLQAQ